MSATERVIIFIDGGFIRKIYQELFVSDAIEYHNLVQGLVRLFDSLPGYSFRANLIRAYYYDAIPNKNDPEYAKQIEYIKSVTKAFYCTVVLGRLVRSSKGRHRQKGVDILLCIDALSKAYQNQYDVAIFLVGDRDFIPLVNAVKNSGKKAFGFYFGEQKSSGLVKTKVPMALCRTFDLRVVLTKEILDDWRKR